MDVSNKLVFRVGLAAIVLLALALRLRGIHNPILDHPGWRQGDTAAIARNFALLDYNPFHPQVDYNGPPPNYVELELQIVPFIAATLYKLFGVHEIFGRLISIAFSVATVPVLAYFGRWLFASSVAGLGAAFCFAVYPGSVYYGRTFTPDTTMVFFLSAALFVGARWIVDEGGGWGRGLAAAAALCALALLAKPVAAVALVPLAAMLVERFGVAGALRRPQTWAFFTAALVPLWLYGAYAASIAEWHWASGITRKHVLPQLAASLRSPGAFLGGVNLMRERLKMLHQTMLGISGLLVALAGLALAKPSRSRALLYGWLGAALVYTYVVVAYEKVDYYLYVFLPLAALWSGGLCARLYEGLPARSASRYGAAAAALLIGALLIWDGRRDVAAYYGYRKEIYRRAKALDATLQPNALIVMGHYDPSILYYINRKGWQEDPYVWTPFDEQSAIKKNALYFVAVEPDRLERNVELYAWLQRFPVRSTAAAWPVYETQTAKILPGAEERWRAFRARERAGA